jgi:predicted NAD-dependent protein-ADP-ribosyltransferase YbiA (DUF1768 family)
MAAELSAALAAYDTAGSTKERAVAASQLAESVRACLDHGQVADAEDDPYGNAATWGYPTIAAGMTIYKEGYPVTIDGVTYSKAMNIFQAMKAPKAQRQKFANASWTDVVAMGREQVIDVTSWDANRETLMESILTAQAKENPGFKKVVLKHANKGLRENSMGDAFWPRRASRGLEECARQPEAGRGRRGRGGRGRGGGGGGGGGRRRRRRRG